MTFEEFTGTRLPALLRFAAVLTGDQYSGRYSISEKSSVLLTLM
jgi:hypothetical protein